MGLLRRQDGYLPTRRELLKLLIDSYFLKFIVNERDGGSTFNVCDTSNSIELEPAGYLKFNPVLMDSTPALKYQPPPKQF